MYQFQLAPALLLLCGAALVTADNNNNYDCCGGPLEEEKNDGFQYPEGQADKQASSSVSGHEQALISPTDDKIDIVAATLDGLFAISLDTLSATAISRDYATRAVVLDTQTGKITWAEGFSVKRAYPNGTESEVLKTFQTNYESVSGMAIDVLTGNIYYGDSSRILVCNSEMENCAALATTRPLVDAPIGLAFNVPQKHVYWSNRGESRNIVKANLDGSNATEIVRGLISVSGIAVDSDIGRLYWAESYWDRISYSDLEGGNIRVYFVDFPVNTVPFGLLIHGDLLYITLYETRMVKSVNKYTGWDFVTVYSFKNNVDARIWGVAVIDSTAIVSYENPCERHACSHLCVPSPHSYRCLCPQNMRLGSNQMTCLSSK